MASVDLINLKLRAGRSLTPEETAKLNAVLDYIDELNAWISARHLKSAGRKRHWHCQLNGITPPSDFKRDIAGAGYVKECSV